MPFHGAAAQDNDMIAASAMLFVAQAVTPCTTAGLPRLGGGAVLVRPVSGGAPMPFLQLGPTTSVRAKPDTIQQTGADQKLPDATESAHQCEAVISNA